MERYCTNCKKDFDFEPLAVSGKGDLICPECGNIIDKNSRNPAGKEMVDETEEKIGRTFANLLHMSYVFYLTMGVLGVIGYVFGLDTLLYIATAISLAAYIIQFLSGTLTFASGLILLPAGAILCWFYFGTLRGACLGIHIVFLIRHIIRDILYTLVFRFISMISGK